VNENWGQVKVTSTCDPVLKHCTNAKLTIGGHWEVLAELVGASS